MAKTRRANYFSRINVLSDAGPAEDIIQALADDVLFQNDLILRQSRRRDIYDRMLERHDEIGSAFDSLVDPIIGAPPIVEPPKLNVNEVGEAYVAEARRQAAILTERLEDKKGYRETVSGCSKVIWRGFGGVELTGTFGLGDVSQGEELLAGAVEIPPESLTFDALGNPRLKLRGVSDVNGIDMLAPELRHRFIVGTWGSTKGGNWFGTGLALRVYWLWWFLTQNTKDWNKALEKFAMPTLLAAVKGKDWETLRKRLLTLFKDYVSDSGLVYPEDQVEIDTIDPTGKFPAYEKFDEVMRKAIRKAILGETLTADQGNVGSQALGTVHANTLSQRQRKIVAWLQDLLSETLVCYMSEALFGGAAIPGMRLNIKFETEQDKTLALQQAQAASTLGMMVKRTELAQKLDFEVVDEDTDPAEIVDLAKRSQPVAPGVAGGGAVAPPPAPVEVAPDPFAGVTVPEGFAERQAGGLVDGRNEQRRLADEEGLVLGSTVRAAKMVMDALNGSLPTRIKDQASKKA